MIGENGLQTLLELWQVSELSLSDFEYIRNSLLRTKDYFNSNLVSKTFKKCSPSGVVAVLLFDNGELSLHTWPEKSYAAFDIYTYGSNTPSKIIKYLLDTFKSKKYHMLTIERGLLNDRMQIKKDEVF